MAEYLKMDLSGECSKVVCGESGQLILEDIRRVQAVEWQCREDLTTFLAARSLDGR